MTVIDEIEKYIPKSMALYDKELLLDNIKIILDEHKFTTPTSPVDELVEKRENEKETDNKDWCYKYDLFYDMFISDLRSLKQIPVAKEDVGEMGKHIMLQPWEYYKDEFGNIITYEDEQKEMLKDSQPKKVKIDRKIKIWVVRQLERPIVNYECDCWPYCLEYGDNYCPQCWVKIKWIA